MESHQTASDLAMFVRRHPVSSYFVMTFAISWTGALLVAAPQLVQRGSLSRLTGVLMFPAMLLGPSLAGIVLTRIVDGPSGLRRLFHGISRLRVPLRWYAGLLLPPALILTVLFFLERFASPVYASNFFLMGVFFGVPAGVLEEIGWTGYAFPKMWSGNAVRAAIVLGILWATWHLPVVNFLGTAVPHHSYWLPFFLAFAVAMTAMRVLICWIYTNTRSVSMAQLMHVSSTSSLVVFSPPRVTAAQEVLWYGLYGALLWAVVALVVKWNGKNLGQAP